MEQQTIELKSEKFGQYSAELLALRPVNTDEKAAAVRALWQKYFGINVAVLVKS